MIIDTSKLYDMSDEDVQDAYAVGDRVTFEGSVWESTIAANVWSPSAYPAGWKKIA